MMSDKKTSDDNKREEAQEAVNKVIGTGVTAGLMYGLGGLCGPPGLLLGAGCGVFLWLINKLAHSNDKFDR